ncbi:MAG TPA: pyridoxal-dependent decarboxylase, exosortase A system-associated [Steroidobacteraceae bacterium]|nr:pyridoxal-dependent decarboxylase, exosortase A system-associated [Steroidobacteraceae bacterium]
MTIDTLTQHEAHRWFEVRDDVLHVGGRSIIDIAAEAGGRPFYVYDRRVMSEKVRELRSTLPREIHLHYALKANPMPDVARHMRSLVDGFDVASIAEMEVALEAGVPADDISFAGPGKSEDELRRAAAAGITINIESQRELDFLSALPQAHARPRIAVRVNPDFELKTSGMKMGGGPKQFGVDAELVPAMLRSLADRPLEFRGFHIFSGSQNLRPEAIIEAQRKSLALAIELAQSAPGPVHSLNLGGGLGIPYFPGERSLDLAPIAENLRELVPQARAQLPQAELILELGRYLVGESGVYCCQVLDRKISRGHVYLVTNGGLHHHLAASGNFGQVLRKNYPVVVANHVRGAAREVASVVGPLCTPLDLLADRMELARAEPGDWIAVLQSGAYGYSASPLAFLSHPGPAQIVVG